MPPMDLAGELPDRRIVGLVPPALARELGVAPGGAGVSSPRSAPA